MKSPLIFYSHSDYSDVWPALFAQTDLFMPRVKKYLFSDTSTKSLGNDWNLIRYNDTLGYQKRVINCLEQVKEETIIFHHEDMFLYGKPDTGALKKIEDVIVSGDLDIVKLTRASYDEREGLRPITGASNLFENPPTLQFAIQPCICNKEKLLALYSTTHGNNIWEFEKNATMVSKYLRIKTAMTYTEGDNKRGMYHWDSSIYPYFATAIVKGRWSMEDYGDLLGEVLQAAGINPEDRGTT